MITEHGWEPMTDKQALDVLRSTKMTIGRQNGKTMFQSLIWEAIAHAVKALEEKVEKETETEDLNDIWLNIEKLSELRSNYNCFDEKEEPYYHALSNAIQALRKETKGGTE